MTYKINYLIPIIVGLFFFSCVKDDDDSETSGPPLYFEVSFYFVDSLGNNLLPYDLPDNPIVNPESFYAYSHNMEDIGTYFHTEEYGYRFRIREKFYNISSDSSWQQDSIFYFYSCFDQICDTVKVYKPDLINGSQEEPALCSAEYIIYQSDTLELPYCRNIPVNFN